MAADKADTEMASDQCDQSNTYRIFPSIRILMIFLAFCGMTAINCGFAAFNFAIVCMVKSNRSEDASMSKYGGEFDWDKQDQANLLAAYAWGAIFTSIPAGWLTDKYGGKFVFLACLIINFVSTAVSPWAAFKGEYWLFAARVFNGMPGGAGWPCVISMATRWGSPKERATFIALSTVGNQFGQLLTVAIAGVLCQSTLGWPSIFYIWAGLTGAIIVVWFLIYSDHPDKCRFLSESEKSYLHNASNVLTDSNACDRPPVPWKYVLFSTAACSIYACHFCNIWMSTFLNEFIPTYGKEVLDLNMASNGFYSALPLMCQLISVLTFGTMADKITCGSRSITFSVKIFNTLCMGVPCVGLLALSFLDRSSGLGAVVFCLCLCTFFYAMMTAGFVRCMVLIAPKFSGTISSISNVWSYLASIIMPYVIGVVTKNGTAPEWHNAFYIGLAISIFGCLEFLIFGTGEEQKWAKQSSENVDTNMPKGITVDVLKC